MLILQDPLVGFCIGKREQPWNAPESNKMNEHMGGDGSVHSPWSKGTLPICLCPARCLNKFFLAFTGGTRFVPPSANED